MLVRTAILCTWPEGTEVQKAFDDTHEQVVQMEMDRISLEQQGEGAHLPRLAVVQLTPQWQGDYAPTFQQSESAFPTLDEVETRALISAAEKAARWFHNSTCGNGYNGQHADVLIGRELETILEVLRNKVGK